MSGPLTPLAQTPVDHFSAFAISHKGGVLNEIFDRVTPADFPVIAQLSKLFNKILWYPVSSYETIPTLNFRRWLCDKYVFEASKNTKDEFLEGFKKSAPERFSEEGKQTLVEGAANLLGIEGIFSKHFSDMSSSFYYENSLTNSDLLKLIHVKMDKELARIGKCAQNLLLRKIIPLQQEFDGIANGKKSELKALLVKCEDDDKKNSAQAQQTFTNRMNPVHQELLQTKPQIAPLALAPPPINPIRAATRSKNIELLHRLVGMIALVPTMYGIDNWSEHLEQPWKAQVILSSCAIWGVAFLSLLPRFSGQPPRHFWHYRNYAAITSSIATFANLGAIVLPSLISYSIPPEWQTTAKTAGWVVSGLLSYKLYSLR